MFKKGLKRTMIKLILKTTDSKKKTFIWVSEPAALKLTVSFKIFNLFF